MFGVVTAVTSLIISAVVVEILFAVTTALSVVTTALSNSSSLVSLHPAKKMCSKTIRKNKLIIIFIRNYILSQR